MIAKTGKRMTREDWLERGLAALADEGVAGLSVERLCVLAGKTRGSFYHHFKDHNEFVMAMLEHWREASTARIIAAVSGVSDPRRQRLALARQTVGLSSASENAIRGWSGTDERARRVILKVDEHRLEFLRQGIVTLAAAAGIRLSPSRARDLALLDYSLFIGVHAIKPEASPKYYLKLNKLSESMLMAWMEKN